MLAKKYIKIINLQIVMKGSERIPLQKILKHHSHIVQLLDIMLPK